MSKKEETKKITYAEAMSRLEAIVALLQNPECDIDKLRDYAQESLELLQFCKSRLTQTDEELKKLLSELEQE